MKQLKKYDASGINNARSWESEKIEESAEKITTQSNTVNQNNQSYSGFVAFYSARKRRAPPMLQLLLV